MSDQVASYHSCLQRSIRWYHKVIVEILFGTAVVNALVLCNERRSAEGRTIMSVTQFRELLCKAMLQRDEFSTLFTVTFQPIDLLISKTCCDVSCQ